MTYYHYASIDGQKIFYREAGPKDGKTIVLLHGFPSSSHMFRDLIPRLADRFHIIAPDYLGFGYSTQPSAAAFQYTFESLTSIVENLLFNELGLSKFNIYMQDYGAPVGFRIASRHPEAIDAIIVQNGNAYEEGISAAFEPLKPFWANRNEDTEKPIRSLLTAETTRFQYTHGAHDPGRVSPDSYTFDQHFLDRPGNDAIQLDLLYDYSSNVAVYHEWQTYFRERQPRTLIVWGQHDPFFTAEGAKAFQRDLPKAELHLLDGGHFALEEHSQTIADYITGFLSSSERQSA
jgi:pimeloyl-ACP methyl ester carboxylesterase